MTLSEIWLLWGSLHHLGHTDRVERFAALVAAHEREACASIADAEMNPNPDTGMPVTQYQSGIFTAAEHIAAAIRARGINDQT